jgi:glycosyltransferase involved in cell wall biosynthesis
MKIRIEVSCLATQARSGVSFYTKRLTEALDKAHNVDLTASYFNFLDRQPDPELTLKHPLDKNRLIPLRVFAKLHSYGLSLPFDLFKSPVDLTIHPNFSLWWSAKSRLNAAVVHDLTYMYFPELVEDKNLAHLRRVVPRTMKEADFVITVSNAVRDELIREFNIDPALCIATPIPPEQVYFDKHNVNVFKKYKLPMKKYIFFIGNMEPRKNLATLIEAYRLLPTELKKEYGLLLGGGKGWKSEKTRAALEAAQAAGENILHMGYIDQKDSPAFFQQASLFVMPSIYEGFGMPVLEALAGKTPVVASDIPVHREAGGDGVLYADPSKPTEFRDRIVELLTSKKLQSELLKKADTHLQTFSWEKNAQTIINKAQELLDHETSRTRG